MNGGRKKEGEIVIVGPNFFHCLMEVIKEEEKRRRLLEYSDCKGTN